MALGGPMRRVGAGGGLTGRLTLRYQRWAIGPGLPFAHNAIISVRFPEVTIGRSWVEGTEARNDVDKNGA